METMSAQLNTKPYVHFPSCNPQVGENHRTVNIRINGSSVSIRCKDREAADNLGRALIGVFNRYLPSNNKQNHA
jgi:hypothetical protein